MMWYHYFIFGFCFGVFFCALYRGIEMYIDYKNYKKEQKNDRP